MNYGRFFKLNQNLSDMVAGVTIFDYTELSACEGLASDNTPSPKYPISMTITDNAVRFKMHYCIYRCLDTKKDNPGDNPVPIYGFSIDDIKRQLNTTHTGDSYEQYEQNHNIVHIEEVILELPFTGFRVNELTETIKKSYIASFPQIYEKYQGDVDVSDDILTGNRFLDQLIKKELSDHNLDSDAISYSTLWLMDLYDNDGNINLQSKGKDDLIDKFLRKLLLDFMFDLKHSIVFQTCAEYDQMYSGLMSNYYFSALIHKCEYYYYRDLTTHAIIELEEKKKIIIKSRKLKKGKDKLLKKEEQRIIFLYAKELVAAEDKWASDIRNPLSEIHFKHDFPDDFSKSGKLSTCGQIATEMHSLIRERMTTTCWNSWFASPEEEMRRLYFPYKTYKNKKDVCNSFTLAEYFHHSPDLKDAHALSKECRSRSSRWFLNRSDFNDVLHLHLFKNANLIFLVLALLAFFIPLHYIENIEGLHNLLNRWNNGINNQYYILWISLGMLLIALGQWITIQYKLHKQYGQIEITYSRYVIKKFWIVAITALLFVLFVALFYIETEGVWTCVLRIIIQCICFLIICAFFIRDKIHPIKNGHLFLPKLTASIMTAWITLSRGFSLIFSFYSSVFVVIILIIIVLCFILYQVNKACPANSSYVSLAKVFKSFEFLIVSYCISLIVGLVVVNYVGEQYFEKSGYLNNSYHEYVDSHDTNILMYHSELIQPDFSKMDTTQVKVLQYNKHNKQSSPKRHPNRHLRAKQVRKDQPTVIRIPIFGDKHYIFVAPRLWLLTSLLAMFVGVFLQMLFFQEKQMTDI